MKKKLNENLRKIFKFIIYPIYPHTVILTFTIKRQMILCLSQLTSENDVKNNIRC